MIQIPKSKGHTPLTLSAWHHNRDILRYLLKVTNDSFPEDDQEGSSTPYTGVAGGDLITLTIQAGFLGT